MLSANEILLLIPFQAGYFLSFSFSLARTSITVFDSSGESGHLCLVPDLRGKFSSFHH